MKPEKKGMSNPIIKFQKTFLLDYVFSSEAKETAEASHRKKIIS
jgi:hypothetical protein